MCRWGCCTVDTSYMCKWCGTNYCKECLRGDFHGLMSAPTKCRQCNQTRCQGVRVDYIARKAPEGDKKTARGRSARASTTRGRSSSRGKSALGGKKKKGKKGTKKKKKR